MNKLIEYLRLTKIHSAGATGFVPILGVIFFSQDYYLLLGLFIMGVFSHIHIFTMNEYLDLKIDKYHAHMGEKPLIKGSINITTAKILSISFFVTTYIFFFLYFPLINLFFKNNYHIFLPIMIYSISIGLHMLYNFIGKKIIGKDFLLASGHFFLSLFGATMVMSSWDQLYIAILIAFYFLIELTITTDLADLKDIENEYKMGCKTPPILLGVKVTSKKIFYSTVFKGYVYGLRIVLFIIILLFLFLGNVELTPTNFIFLSFIILFSISSLIIINSIFQEKIYDRRNIIIKLGINEIFTFGSIPLMIVSIMNVEFLIKLLIFIAIFTIPFIWLRIFLKISYDDIVPIT